MLTSDENARDVGSCCAAELSCLAPTHPDHVKGDIGQSTHGKGRFRPELDMTSDPERRNQCQRSSS